MTTTTSLEIRSLVKHGGDLELSLVETPLPPPTADEVTVRIEAAPMNPSDLWLLFAGADQKTVAVSGTRERPVVTAKIPAGVMAMLAARVDRSMPVGNEGAGTVIAAGSSAAAQALVGKVVSVVGSATYGRYRNFHVLQCMELPGHTAVEGASAFVNPLTSLGMVDTMRREGHTALVHTAAASNLGQMLNRICLREGVPLVNIVRKPEQVEILRALGAVHVCNSSSPSFASELAEAVIATGATLAFDAIGGGMLASQILTAMEVAASRDAKVYSRYGSSTHKQVYIYGSLDPSPTVLARTYGLSWGVGGWLLTPFLQKVGPDRTRELKARVVAELTTTFASHFTKHVSLAGMLRLDEIAVYAKASTGTKYLVVPTASDE